MQRQIFQKKNYLGSKRKNVQNFPLFPTELLLVTDTVDERSDEIPTRYEAEGIFSFINCSMQ